MKDLEQVIRNNFSAWLTKDLDLFSACFAADVFYSECYGPEYHGLAQLQRWFDEWNRHGTVLQWTIKQFIHAGSIVVAEWYFECDYEHNVSGFDGVSIIVFNDENKVISVKEFESKAEHHCPYQ